MYKNFYIKFKRENLMLDITFKNFYMYNNLLVNYSINFYEHSFNCKFTVSYSFIIKEE